jgi:transposase-like protein
MQSDRSQPMPVTDGRVWFEAHLWPSGPTCPHCGSFGRGVTELHGKAHRPGCFQCNACRRQFTVTVGTLLHRTRLSLSQWRTAIELASVASRPLTCQILSDRLGLPIKTSYAVLRKLCALGWEYDWMPPMTIGHAERKGRPARAR